METRASNNEFGSVIHEIQSREIQVSKLEVVKAPADHFGAPGTMTLVLSRTGSGVLSEFRAAIKEGGAKLENFRKKLSEQYRATHGSHRESIAKTMTQSPVLADIRYGGNTLNSGLFVPQHIDCAVAVFPYNGGRLGAEGFELVQYPKDGSTESLEGVVVETSATLSAAEQAALKLVPASQLGRNVGASLDCDTTWWAVGLVGAGLATAATVGALAAAGVIGTAAVILFQMGRETQLSETQIEKLGPAASARALLALRREALLGAKVG